ncbi:MAG: HD domain-containing protein [Proteobacteria bacterium]|nr:HD domain-containing protein [Pseudomonadota bacterium]
MSTENNTSIDEPRGPAVVNLIGPQNNRNVLFVDDESLILRAFARDLHDTDVEVTLARTATEGLDALNRQSFAVVLSDFQMPGMDGIVFLEEVRRIDPDAVRILVSGIADFKMAIQVINRVGLFNFIAKPWESYELRDILRRAMEHYAVTVENRRLSTMLSSKCAELGQLARGLENEVQDRTTSLLLGLVNALDLRDTETQWHSRRVALYSRRLAEELGLKGDELLSIERGALLHDVGKIGVSDTILLKPGKLTDEEWVEMRRHSEYGYRILEKIEFLGNARLLVWQHHERWDGNGYPLKLAGDKTYIGARIFAIIDTYDAMTSDRPYRKALSHEVACEEINRMRGTQFDPSIVDAWEEIPKSEIMTLRESVANPIAGID